MVSIIVPIYNVKDYILKCLQSVAEQTYTGDIECLLIDDCGQDNSIQLAEEFVNSYKGPISFRIIHHQSNRGLSAARNTGIRESKGEWLYFLDSDDWITNDCIQSLADCVNSHPKVDMVQGTIFSDDIDMNKRLHDAVLHSETKSHLLVYSKARHYLQSLPHISMAQNRLINKQWLIKHQLFFKEGLIHEDEHWTLRAGRDISSVFICSKDTYFYTINQSGIMSSFDKRRFNSICFICDDILSTTKYKTIKDEIPYLCYLADLISLQSKNNTLLSTNYCNTHLFNLMLDRYKNGRFGPNIKFKTTLKNDCYFLLIYISIKLRYSFINKWLMKANCECF